MADRCPSGLCHGSDLSADSGSLLRGDDTARFKSVIRELRDECRDRRDVDEKEGKFGWKQ